MDYIQYMKPGSKFWQNLGDAIKYARSTSTLDGGGSYYVTSQAKEDLRKQGKEDEAKQVEQAEAVGTVGGAIAGLTLGKGVPLITRGISAFRSAFPKLATGIDFVLTADGIRNLATENGIQKTINYINDGNWGRAAASGAIDALDLLGGIGIIGDVIKGAKWAKGAYIARQMNKALEQPTNLVFNPDNMYRVIGSTGFKDAMQTGVLRNNINGRSTRGVYFTQGKVNDIDNPIQGFVRSDGTLVKQPQDRVYLGDVIAEVPTTHRQFNQFQPHSVPEWSIFKTQNPISINGVKFYKRTSPNTYIELPHTPQMPQPQVYGNWSQSTNGFNLGYTTSGIKQTGTPTGNFHWREDITDIDNPILLDVKPDMHYTRTRTTPVIKEVTNVDDMLQRIGVVPISNTPVQAVEQITVNPTNRLVKVGERIALNLSPNRVVQFEYHPRLVDNKGRLVSSDADRYFGIPTKTETQYTLWHKSGGTIKIKKKNKGKFTASAKAAGEGVQEHAHKVMNDPNATPLQKKRANFAIQAKKWHRKHQSGGKINYLNYFNHE